MLPPNWLLLSLALLCYIRLSVRVLLSRRAFPSFALFFRLLCLYMVCFMAYILLGDFSHCILVFFPIVSWCFFPIVSWCFFPLYLGVFSHCSWCFFPLSVVFFPIVRCIFSHCSSSVLSGQGGVAVYSCGFLCSSGRQFVSRCLRCRISCPTLPHSSLSCKVGTACSLPLPPPLPFQPQCFARMKPTAAIVRTPVGEGEGERGGE